MVNPHRIPLYSIEFYKISAKLSPRYGYLPTGTRYKLTAQAALSTGSRSHLVHVFALVADVVSAQGPSSKEPASRLGIIDSSYRHSTQLCIRNELFTAISLVIVIKPIKLGMMKRLLPFLLFFLSSIALAESGAEGLLAIGPMTNLGALVRSGVELPPLTVMGGKIEDIEMPGTHPGIPPIQKSLIPPG